MKKYYVMPKKENIQLVDFSNAYTTNNLVCLELKNKTIKNSAENFEKANELIKHTINKFIKGSINSISISGNSFDLTFHGSDTIDTFSKFNYGVFSNNIPQYDKIEFSVSGLVKPNTKSGSFKIKTQDIVIDNISTVYCHINGDFIDEFELNELCVRIDCKYINVFNRDQYIYTFKYVGINTSTGEEINNILAENVILTNVPQHLNKYLRHMMNAKNNISRKMANVV